MIYYYVITQRNVTPLVNKMSFDRITRMSSGKVRMFDFVTIKFYFLTDGHQSDFANEAVMNRVMNEVMNR